MVCFFGELVDGLRTLVLLLRTKTYSLLCKLRRLKLTSIRKREKHHKTVLLIRMFNKIQ